MKTKLLALFMVLVVSSWALYAGTAGGTLLFNGKGSTGTSSPFRVTGKDVFTTIIEGDNVTTGATIDIEARTQRGTWVAIHTAVMSSSTNTQVIQYTGPFEDIRANVTAYTDGLYTVTLLTLQNN